MSDDLKIDDPSDDPLVLLAHYDTTGGKFASMLEKRMAAGYRDLDNKRWALQEMGIADEAYRKIKALILWTWKTSTKTLESVVMQRDQIRRGYWEVYQRALDKEKLDTAIKALDALCRLDGLDAPSQLMVTVQQGQITNSARERFSGLMTKMQDLASGRSLRNLKSANGSNGHNNGHAILDVKPPGEEEPS